MKVLIILIAIVQILTLIILLKHKHIYKHYVLEGGSEQGWKQDGITLQRKDKE